MVSHLEHMRRVKVTSSWWPTKRTMVIRCKIRLFIRNDDCSIEQQVPNDVGVGREQ